LYGSKVMIVPKIRMDLCEGCFAARRSNYRKQRITYTLLNGICA